MFTLVSKDGKEFNVSNNVISQFHTLQIMSEHTNLLHLSIDSKILRVLISPPEIQTIPASNKATKEILNNLIEALDYLDANEATWKVWIRKLPDNYDIVLHQYLTEKIWNIPNAPVPTSYYNTEEERDAWKNIISLVNNTIGVKARDIYIAYLVMLRIRDNDITIEDYNKIVSEEVYYEINISKSNVKLFDYNMEKIEDTNIYDGYTEIFAMLSTAENEFMPKNIFTYSPDELSLQELTQLVTDYSKFHDKVIKLPSPVPIVQRFFRMWTIACEKNRETLSISSQRVEWKYGTGQFVVTPLNFTSLWELSIGYVKLLLKNLLGKFSFRYFLMMIERENASYDTLMKYLKDRNIDNNLGQANADFVRWMIPHLVDDIEF